MENNWSYGAIVLLSSLSGAMQKRITNSTKSISGGLSPVRQSNQNKKGTAGHMLPPLSSHRTGPGFGGKEGQQQQQQQQLMEKQLSSDTMAPELDLDETLRIREVFAGLVRDEYITTKFSLRVVLASLGMYPSDEELSFVLNAYENKVSLTTLCKYLRFYKKIFQRSARRSGGSTAASSSLQEDVDDTLRAFVSLGGQEDCTGTIAVEDLRQVCRNFGLTIDIDVMHRSVGDGEIQTTLNYTEFCDIFRQHQISKEGSTICPNSNNLSSFTLGDPRPSSYAVNADPILSIPNTTNSVAQGPRSCETSVDGRRFASEPLRASGSFPAAAAAIAPSAAAGDAHLESLRAFLFPNSAACGTGVISEGARIRLPAPVVSLQSPGASCMDFGERACAAVHARGRSKKDSILVVNTGGYRAPSPIILSLRNITAQRQARLRSFSQKMKERKLGSAHGRKWRKSHSLAAADDDE